MHVLMESLVVCEPNSSGKMVIFSMDQQLILCQIVSAIREVRDQNEGENGKDLHPRGDILDVLMLALRLGSQHKSTI